MVFSCDALRAAVRASFPHTVARLAQAVAIPSCSFPGYPASEVERSAADTAAWLSEAGWPEVRLVRLPGVHPYVLGHDRRAGPTAPTILLYAHHDVQPPMRAEGWTTPAFSPTVRDGRLYGRGAADDKAGIAVHAEALRAWVAVAGQAPVNLTVVIEGEEETGSHHFNDFLAAYRDELRADVLVIADLANAEAGLPSLTTSLRGLVAFEVEVRTLRRPVHSGIWGGAVIDPTLTLCRLLAGLSDAQGNLAVPELLAQVRQISDAERADLARIPTDPARIQADAGSLAPLSATGADLWERLWRQPSISVNAIQAGVRGQTGNVVMDAAWARVGVRIVPDMAAASTAAALTRHLRAACPPGVELTVTPASQGEAWATATSHPAFAAARRALHAGYGVAPVEIGCGASIPFVAAMTAALGNPPALLLGVEDPRCNAHSEDESVDLADLERAIVSAAALFGEVATAVGTAVAESRGHGVATSTT